MKINPIFGFLGSGKTTLIRRILQEQIDLSGTAVIVNEFGNVGVDGTLIAADGIDVIELTSGCLCCNLKGPMLNAIEDLHHNQSIQHLLIESSGLAEPKDTLESFNDPRLRDWLEIGPVVTVVNTPKFPILMDSLGDFYIDQIRNADMLLLNKIDLGDADLIESTRTEIREVNTRADIFYTEQCDLNIPEFLARTASTVVDRIENQATSVSSEIIDQATHSAHHHSDHSHVDSLVVEINTTVRKSAVKQWFREFGEQLYRAKGFMNIDGKCCIVQYSTGQLDIEPTSLQDKMNMVFIGKSIDRETLRKELHSIQSH